MKLLQNLKQKRLKKKYPKWGSPILDIYTYEGLLVVATKLDVFVSDNGVYFERVLTGDPGERPTV